MDANVKSVTRFGRFTIAEVEQTVNEKTYVGVGIARQSNLDKFRPDVGSNIATSRAKKALARKIAGKAINSALMG